MKVTRSLLAALGALLAIPPASAAPPPPARHVLVISIDGVPHDSFESSRAHLPHLDALARAGVRGPSRTVFPSMTWPSHTSLATGRTPAGHGVLGNRYFDRDRKKVRHASTVPFKELVRATPLWKLVTDARGTAAAVYWAGTQGAPGLTWNVPEVYRQSLFRKYSTRGLLRELARAGIPTDKLGSFSRDQDFLQDSAARDIAVYLTEKYKPTLQLVHFLSVDTVSHKYGPRNRMVRWSLELVDRYIGDVLAAYERAGIRDRTNVFVVSDHGFHEIEERVDADRILHDKGLVANLDKLDRGPLRTVYNGHALFVYLVDRRKGRKLRAAAMKALGAVPQIRRIFEPRQFGKLGLPKRSKDERAPDLIALCDKSCMFSKVSKGDTAVAPGWGGGMHGNLPDAPENWPMFVAAGPDIAQRSEPVEMSNLDLAPTAARLMGLAFPGPVDGKVREDLLRKAPVNAPQPPR